MQKIPLSSVTSDMILARDIFRGNMPVGMPVCNKGTQLTDDLIKRLENLDILSVYVEGCPVQEEGNNSLDIHLRELDGRFIKTFREPLNAILYNTYKAYLIRSMGGNSGRQTE